MKITESQLRNIISKSIKESLENINQGQDITSIMASLKMKPWVGGDDFSMIDPARIARHRELNAVTFTINGKSFISRVFHHLDKAFDFAEALTNNLKQAGFDLSETSGYIESFFIEKNEEVESDPAACWVPEYDMWID